MITKKENASVSLYEQRSTLCKFIKSNISLLLIVYHLKSVLKLWHIEPVQKIFFTFSIHVGNHVIFSYFNYFSPIKGENSRKVKATFESIGDHVIKYMGGDPDKFTVFSRENFKVIPSDLNDVSQVKHCRGRENRSSSY